MKKLFYTISLTAFLLSNIASANLELGDAFDQINNSFSAGLTARHFNYREDINEVNSKVPGMVEVYGESYGLAIGTRNVFFQRLYTDLSGEYAMGKLRYKGFKQYTNEASNHREEYSFADVDTKLGVIILDNKFLQIIPLGGLGFHFWSHDSGHKYYHFKATVGGRINCAFSDNFVLSPYANVGTTFGAHAKGPVFDQPKNYQGKSNHKLGNKLITEYGLEINYRLDHELFLIAMVSHAHFEYGKSAKQIVGNTVATEPNSKTNELKVGVGMRFGFM